ncbi:oligosaccharide flippase family protein [Paenibacillus polygoni]|uniref:Oligosaccharide flippase family protein n=1 Tax=Paenibacillus polygoni TaxID=3050112 RepID=A0ABY8X699_9BACL|nr:oligosaccharide flippase family protein [Paenibacillus polygoni]WIV20011.1 oligosaccharide flippase family protein [Paenibacillus polygoni]
MFKTVKTNKDRNILDPLSLKKNFSWTFVGNLIYALTQWGLLVSLAKFGDPEMVGQFSLALAITAPVLMLTNLQLREIQSTDTDNLYVFGDYLGLRILTSLIAFIAIFLISLNYPWEISLVIICIGIAKIVESLSEVIFGLLQKNEVMDRIATSIIIKGILSLIFLSVTIRFTGNLLIGTFAMTIAWGTVLIFYDIRNAIYFEKIIPIFNKSKIKKIVILSFPLGLTLMIGSLTTNLPRYFIEYYVDTKALGHFAAMAYLIIAGNIVVNALSQSASPKLAKYFASNKMKDFNKLIMKIMAIGFTVGILGVCVAFFGGEDVLTIIYDAEYAKYIDVFVLIMIAGLINYTGACFGYGITAARAFKIQPYMAATWIVATLFFSYILIPGNGIKGASIALIYSAIVQFVTKLIVLSLLVKKKIKGSK